MTQVAVIVNAIWSCGTYAGTGFVTMDGKFRCRQLSIMGLIAIHAPFAASFKIEIITENRRLDRLEFGLIGCLCWSAGWVLSCWVNTVTICVIVNNSGLFLRLGGFDRDVLMVI